MTITQRAFNPQKISWWRPPSVLYSIVKRGLPTTALRTTSLVSKAAFIKWGFHKMQQTNHLYMTYFFFWKKFPSFVLVFFKTFNQADVKMVQGLPEKNDKIIVMHLSFFYITSSFINFRLFTTQKDIQEGNAWDIKDYQCITSNFTNICIFLLQIPWKFSKTENV